MAGRVNSANKYESSKATHASARSKYCAYLEFSIKLPKNLLLSDNYQQAFNVHWQKKNPLQAPGTARYPLFNNVARKRRRNNQELVNEALTVLAKKNNISTQKNGCNSGCEKGMGDGRDNVCRTGMRAACGIPWPVYILAVDGPFYSVETNIRVCTK
jgi:hypothetical protein